MTREAVISITITQAPVTKAVVYSADRLYLRVNISSSSRDKNNYCDKDRRRDLHGRQSEKSGVASG
jgi:hypothetical protein